MSDKQKRYTTQLQAGLGLIEETKLLLSVYRREMTVTQLYETALESGLFPMISARRLRNVIAECFSPRYIKTDAAQYLKKINQSISATSFNQFLLIFTALANRILCDFIIEVYWNRYSSGRDTLSINDARDFVNNGVREGKTKKIWSDSTITKVSSLLDWMLCRLWNDLFKSLISSSNSIDRNRGGYHAVFLLASLSKRWG